MPDPTMKAALDASDESFHERPRNRHQFKPSASIALTTIGSRGVRLEVEPTRMREAAGGATVWVELHDGPLALTLNPRETDWLVWRLVESLIEGRAGA